MTQLEPDRLDGYGGSIICNHLGEIDHAVNGVNPVVCALTGGLPSASLIDRIGGQNHTHRPVKINPQNGQFKLNEGNPISCHLLVVWVFRSNVTADSGNVTDSPAKVTADIPAT